MGAGEEKFLCEKYGCLITAEGCISRQKKAIHPYAGPRRVPYDPGCIKCEQGMKIMQEAQNKKKEQAGYKICANKDCPHGGKPQPIENFSRNRQAKDGHKTWCKTCDSSRSRTYYHKKKCQRELRYEDPAKAAEDLSAGDPENSIRFDGIQEMRSALNRPDMYQFTITSGPAKGATFLSESLEPKAIKTKISEMLSLRQSPLKPNQDTAKHSLTIDFSRHLELLKMLCQVADEELRSPANQVLWFVRKCLDNEGRYHAANR